MIRIGDNMYFNTVFLSSLILSTFAYEINYDPMFENFLKFAFMDDPLSTIEHQESGIDIKCLMDISQVYNDVKTGNFTQFKYAFKMMDAQGKPPSGVIYGNTFWIGNYFECVKSHHPIKSPNTAAFEGQYCLVRLNVEIAKEYIPLTIGTCFPDSCTEKDVDALWKNRVVKKINTVLHNTSSVNTSAGLTTCNMEVEWTSGTTAALSIVIIMICLMVIGTIMELAFNHYDKMKDKNMNKILPSINVTEPSENTGLLAHMDGGILPLSRSEEHKSKLKVNICHIERCRILCVFSIIKNTESLLDTKTLAGRLTSLDGIRVLSMWWVILGHTYIFITNNTVNLLQAVYIRRRFSFLPVNNASFSVDTFFLISGTLVTFMTLRKMKSTNGKMNWILFYVHRVWRLTPVYGFVLLCYSALFIHALQGPYALYLMNTRLYRLITICYTKWWTNLLYINNFYPNLGDTNDMCLPWSWYLANDMQFYIISPLIILLLYRRRRVGLIVICILIICCVFIRALTIRFYHIDYFNEVISFRGKANDQKRDAYGNSDPLYNKPYTRMAPFLVGMILGYILQKKEWKTRIHKIWVYIGWMFCFGVGLLIVYGPYKYMRTYTVYSATSSIMYGTFSRLLWGLTTAWIIFACSVGYGGLINTVLSWKLWIPLGRLTYSAYLVHPVVIYYFLINSQQQIVYTDIEAAWLYVGNIVMSFAAAYVLYVLVEAPMTGIVNFISKGIERKNT